MYGNEKPKFDNTAGCYIEQPIGAFHAGKPVPNRPREPAAAIVMARLAQTVEHARGIAANAEVTGSPALSASPRGLPG